ncbi:MULTISPECIES: NAD-dependent succinate-semialdehyde dehydrogenase [unclassified Brenneria]|uniref:NAD-dependent succinate-semialdehyde dehydrogenase n=1 Tax=unclassified Brenneria TaxID=2634434 RepID=UPI00155413B4|nr:MULTISPECIES: NAD-dependent succinate-semialdehyde dehydrogenase [unclassified Brenneria]MBJ7220913.1 NAD-dependent succinate-semialdehyde dehydrogenase [Brenneria sp. L3-3C-1]MEE3642154.1 NAD-dependent succinate-semialdehyde dehydrogenase [Brenneria sp. L3_3C_1]MEE3650473.1 NAD-dependent succinate-semialdehyde dehydrogenase [Brenneria sp. HEZEL_4_2_4]NPD00429.1 NAD-dependent succinate-semialdehyde dehydrogenase [Brenneria sp. hezel4-2-4]
MQLKQKELLRQSCLIDGEWHDSQSGEKLDVTNPATGDVLGTVPLVTPRQTEQAIAAAEQALTGWRQRTGKERAAAMQAWSRLIMDNQEDLALLLTAEQGKPLAEARGEIAYAASFIDWFAEEAKRIEGSVLQSPQGQQRLLVIKQPIGVCAAITPWNFPAAMITRKVAPALAAGCTMIVKPAEQTPFTALALGELAQQAGIPRGVLQVITGDSKSVGKVLCDSPVVRKLSFTGSTEVGRILMAQSAPTVKKLSLELGGNAPFIVFDDADVDLAVKGILASKFRNSGQTCVCANRIYVQTGIYSALVEKLVEEVKKLKVGDGTQPGVTQGPLIDADAIDKVQQHIADALKQGATLLLGGKPHELGGTFFTPTIVGDVTRDMRFAREETFGPVAPLFQFSDEAEVVAMANDTEFGLAAYVYTRDAIRQWTVPEALEYGMVGINTGLISNEVAPFGGVKQSGLGREGSRFGIEDYLEMKYLCVDLSR